MFIKILEKLDGLFTVKQTQYTRKRVFFNLFLAILVIMSLPIYFYYEDWNYEKYLVEYNQASQLINEYTEVNGVYPIGEAVEIQKEKDLYDFFKEMNLSLTREFYYVDMTLLPEFKDFKYTYIIDSTNRYIYTSESVVYKMARWHYARPY